MVEQLFGSKTRVKLLHLFYSNPNRSFYVREITRKIDEQINSVRRELSNLLSIGIIGSDTTNNRLYYEVDQKYEYYDPLSVMFGVGGVKPKKSVSKTTGVTSAADPEPGEIDIKSIGNVEIAVFTGQFTRDETTGIDVFFVGDINHTKLQKFMGELEVREGKELRYTMMSPSDFHYRQQIKDRFVANIFSAKKQVLIDKNNVLVGATANT